MPLSDKILDFLFGLEFPFQLPPQVEVMRPFSDAETARVVESFYNKYYNDDKPRYCIIGINPGRFGGGVTGIPFTDPIRLEKECGIKNDFIKKQELSSVFIYEMINAYGGVEKFYHNYYISAISPLGFVKDGKNLNYYDDKSLMKKIEPFVADCINKQLSFGLST